MRSAYFVMAKIAGIPILSTVSILLLFLFIAWLHDSKRDTLRKKKNDVQKKKKSKKGLTVK